MQIYDLLTPLQAIVALAGVVVVYYAYRGYGKTGSKSLLFLALGFVFITIGSVTDDFLTIASAEMISASGQLIGFLLIVYSIIGPRN